MQLSLFAALCSIIISADIYPANADEGTRLHPIPIKIATPQTLEATFKTVSPDRIKGSNSLSRGNCPSVAVSLSDSDFDDGQYYLQAGFAQGESLGATYYVPVDQFPIKIDVMEVLFGTSSANQQTTTHWSVTVWDGTPENGIQVASFASDDIILPHLVMPPGTNGIIISVSVDPEDPDQIYIYNDSGASAFSIAFKVEQHNNPGNPCLTTPPENSNAFPCTDLGGLQFPNQNWIDAVSGTFCVCGSGWMTFQQLPGLCTPSGDWLLRAAYTPVTCSEDPIACCYPDDSCFDLSPTDCAVFGGNASAPGTTCATLVCGSGLGACCVESTGNCVNFDLNTCLVVGGIHLGEGTTCETEVCFPDGACCLPDGACIGPVSDEDCIAVGGNFQGDQSNCSSADCPQPIGACCGPDWCTDISQDDCIAVGGAWTDASTLCDSLPCQTNCPEDLNEDGFIDVTDLLQVVGDWGLQGGASDIDGSGVVDTGDLLAVIGAWGQCV